MKSVLTEGQSIFTLGQQDWSEDQLFKLRLNQHYIDGAFHLRTSVYFLRTLVPSFAHDSAYRLCTFFHTSLK